jgi:hypothetical protein
MDYQSNSNKSKQQPIEEKKIDKVVTGVVVKKQRTFGEKFKGVFFGGDTRSSLRYLAAEVLLPAFRNLMVDATTKGVERLVYGESMRSRRAGSSYPSQYGSRIQYNSPVRRDRAYLPDQGPPRDVRIPRRTQDEFILSNREDAELVLERLVDCIDKYQVASVADLLDLMGQPTSHVDNKWGWTYLNNAEIRQVRDGYLLDLPPVEEI